MDFSGDLLLKRLYIKNQIHFRQKHNSSGNLNYPSKFKIYGSASYNQLNALSRTSIMAMEVRRRASGKYLLLQIVNSTNVTNTDLITVVQDNDGTVIPLCLKYFRFPDFPNTSGDPLPKGTFLALKEPTIEFQVERNCYLLTVTSPTDIVMIRESSPLYEPTQAIHWLHPVAFTKMAPEQKTASAWKELGNKFYRQNKFSSALEAYLVALKTNDSQDESLKIILLSNIAQTYFQLGHLEMSIDYSDKVLMWDPENKKALYRLGCAHYKLRQFELAEERFEFLLMIEPENKDGEREVEKCRDRLQETTDSIVKRLHHVGWEKPNSEIDCSDFIGPIEIASIPGKGKGYIAKEIIKPGRLLLISKAVGTLFYNVPVPAQEELKGVEHLSINVANGILRNPRTIGKLVYDLKEDDDQPLSHGDQVEPVVDLQRIHDIVQTRCFGIKTLSPDMFMGDAFISGYGFFISPSFFNHSCNPNASHHIYGDVFVVFSNSTINKGEEVNISYVNGLDRFQERKEQLALWKFDCSCEMCTEEGMENVNVQQKRTSLLSVLITLLNSEDPNLSSLEVVLKKMEDTYNESNCVQMKTDLLGPYLLLAKSYNQIEDFKKQGETAEKALKSVGINIPDLLKMGEDNQLTEINIPGEVELFVAIGLLKSFYKRFSYGKFKSKLCDAALHNLEQISSGGDQKKLNARLRGLEDCN